MDQPRVPAGSSKGGQFTFKSGSNAGLSSGVGGVSVAADQILERMSDDDPGYYQYGLRVIEKDYKSYRSVKEGDVLESSYDWIDGNSTGVKLNGTSAIEIRSKTKEGVLDALSLLGADGKNGKNGFYFGDKVLLIEGEIKSKGADYGEAIFKSARVIGVWKKPSAGLSAVMPNK